MNLPMGLDQFWRVAELRHVAAEEGTLSTIHLRVDVERDGALVATATNSSCLAQWDITPDFGDFDLPEPVLLSAAGVGEALAACKGMVKVDRGKWDPVGWKVKVSGEGDSIVVSAYDPFGERRGDFIVSVFHGTYPDYASLFDSKVGERTDMGVSPKQLVALAKTTTITDRAMFLSFHGDSAAHVTCFEDDWRGLVVPIHRHKAAE